MTNLEEKLAEIRKEEQQILKKIDKRNAKRKIQCKACDSSHEIRDLTAIQTHWYTPPRGCTEGDYWSEGELQFICPETGNINRLLFDKSDIYWEKKTYENDPEKQFKSMYTQLFKKIIDEYDGIYKEKSNRVVISDQFSSKKSINNYYVDKNRKKFGLVEKVKKQK